MVTDELKISLTPRAVGVVVLRADSPKNRKFIGDEALTNLLRQSRVFNLDFVDESVVGFQPYAGMKLNNYGIFPDYYIVGLFEIYKDKQLVWRIYDIRELTHGIVFDPVKAFRFGSLPSVSGLWKLVIKTLVLPKESLPRSLSSDFFKEMGFQPVQSFDWKITGVRIKLDPTGDAEGADIYKVDPNRIVNLDDIFRAGR